MAVVQVCRGWREPSQEGASLREVGQTPILWPFLRLLAVNQNNLDVISKLLLYNVQCTMYTVHTLKGCKYRRLLWSDSVRGFVSGSCKHKNLKRGLNLGVRVQSLWKVKLPHDFMADTPNTS